MMFGKVVQGHPCVTFKRNTCVYFGLKTNKAKDAWNSRLLTINEINKNKEAVN